MTGNKQVDEMPNLAIRISDSSTGDAVFIKPSDAKEIRDELAKLLGDSRDRNEEVAEAATEFIEAKANLARAGKRLEDCIAVAGY